MTAMSALRSRATDACFYAIALVRGNGGAEYSHAQSQDLKHAAELSAVVERAAAWRAGRKRCGVGAALPHVYQSLRREWLLSSRHPGRSRITYSLALLYSLCRERDV
jgi:hypothetical protein